MKAYMTQKTAGQTLLENAYKLSTPGDNIAYYREFAASYDSDFAQGLGWIYPKAIAAAYHAAGENSSPIADIGCGTGYVAMELGVEPNKIDGFDISPEMLAVAQQKNLYRSLFQVDLTGPLDKFVNTYAAVLSAGTFTHGHLGPDVLRSLLVLARSGGLFIIGVNQAHFEKKNFSNVLDALVKEQSISAVKMDRAKIYSEADHEHSGDHAIILQFRKT
jgi:predicted TPR repeat methyltransferase